MKRDKENKLTFIYDPDTFKVLARKGEMLIVERGNKLCKRRVAHVKQFMQSEISVEASVEREISQHTKPDGIELTERQKEITEPMKVEHRATESQRAEIMPEIIEPTRADQRLEKRFEFLYS